MGALFSRIWPHLLVAGAIIGLILYIDHRGYQRAMEDRDRRDAKQLSELRKAIRESDERLVGIVGRNDTDLAGKLDRLRVVHTTVIQPTIEREIDNDPRLADPAMRYSDGLLRGLNAARASSSCAGRADGGIECAVPRPAADPGSAVLDAAANQR